MRKNNNTIEINGQRYDAKTGALLSGSAPTKISVHVKSAAPAHTATGHTTSKHRSRPPARHHASHPPAASRTLMRQAVKKPAVSRKHHLHAQGHTDLMARRTAPAAEFKMPLLQVDEKRLQRAKRITKSRLISRFAQATSKAQESYWTSAAAEQTPIPAAPAARAQAAVHKPTRHRASSTEALLENALAHATSYRELPKAKRHRLKLKRNAGAHL